MFAVEPAHRAAAAHKAEAKAAPSPATPDLFASVFQAAQSERAQQQQVAPKRSNKTELPQRKSTARTSNRSGKESAPPPAKSKPDENTAPKSSRADQLRESTPQNDIPSDPISDEAPIETEDVAVTDAPEGSMAGGAEASQEIEATVLDTPQEPIAVLPHPQIGEVAEQTQEPTAEAFVVYTPQAQQSPAVNGIKPPRPHTPRSNHASEQSVVVTSNNPDAHEAADGNPTPQFGVKIAPGFELKGNEPPINELPRTHEMPVRPNGLPEPSNAALQNIEKPHSQAPARVHAPILVEGKTDSTGINLNESKSIGELAHVLRAATGKSGQSSMFLQLDPPELGQVRIGVRLHEQLMTLRFETQTPAGREALQSKLADLRSALEQHGVQLGHVSVELRPPVSPENQVQNSHQQHGLHSQGEFHPGGSGHSQPQEQSPGFGTANSSEPSAMPGEMGTEINQTDMGLTAKRVDVMI